MSAPRSEVASGQIACLARALFGADVAVAADDPRLPATGLAPTEAAAAETMVARRRREFAAGRRAARAALGELGAAPAAIPHGPDRAPVWPPGLIGSISHSPSSCIAAVCRTGRLAGIGLDIEPDEPLPLSLWDAILTADERRWVERSGREAAGRLARMVFSAKEAVYKCQYPATRTVLDFQDVEIDPDGRRGDEFRVALRSPGAAIGVVAGRVGQAGSHLLAIATIERTGDLPPERARRG